ncbi:MAG: SprB repeat-containing protein, partial [Saprospiraceae bacterium]|nr:SprB repeat-containing protein [Saprospiraceae bacterium]
MGRNLTSTAFRANKHFLIGLVMLCFMPFLTNAQVSVTVTGTNIPCYGSNNGTATAIASGGWAPYTYHWSTGATTSTINSLPPGTYYVTVTDIDLGFAVGSITITQPPAFGVLVQATQPQLCGIAPDGTMTATPYGGVPPLTLHWSNGQTTPVITGLSQGTYTVTVTDANGCTAVGSGVILYNPEGIWLGDSTHHVSCKGLNNGFIHVGAMTGTPPYTILWNNGSTSFNLFNLAPGFYSGTVTDANGCTAVRNITITEPALALTGTGSSTNANCGLAGSATVTPSGGTAPYSILWSTGAVTNTISVMPGTYTATVTDANGCTASTSVTVGGSTSTVTVNTSVLTNAGCTVGGSASATASGGTGNYAYVWDNGQTTSTATNLTAGTHKVTVTDITTGCQGMATVNIPTAPTLTTSTTLTANATCLVGGSATANPSGGSAPYTYLWDNGQTTQTATNLSAGPHTVTVRDAGGCQATAMVTIGQTQGPNVTVNVVTNATCTTGGSATAVANGTAPFIYLWSNGQTTATATNLPVGPAKVTVTDVNGCATTGMATITQPSAPTAVIANSTNSSCSNPTGSATAAASGGTGTYTYKWSNNATTAVVNNLSPGTYTVTVTDQAGCTATAVVSIA